MTLYDVLRATYPGLDFGSECRLRDDGSGPYIAEWHRAEPQPNEADLLANFDVTLYENRRTWKQQAADRKARAARKTLALPDSADPQLLQDKLNAALALLELRT